MMTNGAKRPHRGRLFAVAGLLAGIGGARAALAAHDDAAPANDALHVGAVNDRDVGSNALDTGITTRTTLVADVSNAVLLVRNVNSSGSDAILAEASNTGVNGFAPGHGVVAHGGDHTSGGDSSGNGAGHGVNANGGSSDGTSPFAFGGDGVRGVGGTGSSIQRFGAGVRGLGTGPVGIQGPGVVGETTSGVHPGVAAVNLGFSYGLLATSSAGVGVRGIAFGASAAAVEGVASGNGPGVWGFTSSGHAILGNSTTGNGGVFSGKTGVTTTGSPNALVANGNVTATGTGHFGGGIVVSTRWADGGLRATYGVTSPDALVEDVGRARLVNGQARVELDPAFAALVGSVDYAVFPVARGSCGAIFVSNFSAMGFELHESNGGSSTVDIDYRVVAKRAGTQAARFARVAEPELVSIPAMRDVPKSMDELSWLHRAHKSQDRPERGTDGVTPSSGGQPSPRR
jgi:hypothetical protein